MRVRRAKISKNLKSKILIPFFEHAGRTFYDFNFLILDISCLYKMDIHVDNDEFADDCKLQYNYYYYYCKFVK